MFKEYLAASQLVDLLTKRGLACDERTERTLLREGYYAIINGYGKYFLDAQTTQATGEDQYAQGSTFRQVYRLFLFDRSLRMLTFNQLTKIEGMLRSLVSTSFLEAHEDPEAYLQEACFSTRGHYLLGEASYERDLRNLMRALTRYAREHENDERGRDDARLAHYRNNYDYVPLWVVFSDFSFGNLYYFLALMKRSEQEAVCARLNTVVERVDASQTQRTRKTLVQDVGLLVEVRNICAHGERLFDACPGERDTLGYASFIRIVSRYLPAADMHAFAKSLTDLFDQHTGRGELLDRVLGNTGIREAAQQYC